MKTKRKGIGKIQKTNLTFLIKECNNVAYWWRYYHERSFNSEEYKKSFEEYEKLYQDGIEKIVGYVDGMMKRKK